MSYNKFHFVTASHSIIIYCSIGGLMAVILGLVTVLVRQLCRTREELSTIVMENDLYGLYEEDSTAITDYNVYYQDNIDTNQDSREQ